MIRYAKFSDAFLDDSFSEISAHFVRILQDELPSNSGGTIDFVAEFCINNSTSFAPWMVPILIQLNTLRVSDHRVSVRSQAALAIDKIINSCMHYESPADGKAVGNADAQSEIS